MTAADLAAQLRRRLALRQTHAKERVRGLESPWPQLRRRPVSAGWSGEVPFGGDYTSFCADLRSNSHAAKHRTWT